MTREEFISDLETLGTVESLPQAGGTVLAVLAPQPVPGTGRSSRVAILLPEVIAGRPVVFVDGDLRTRSGGSPNNWKLSLFGTEYFGSWSLATSWSPEADSAQALVFAALDQWDR